MGVFVVQCFARMQAIAWLILCSAVFHDSAAAQVAAEEEAPVVDQATKLFQEGRALMSEGKYGAACAKLEESMKIKRGIGTLYNVADCYEKLGHTAKAWRHFREAASKAAASGDGERATAAQERADALEPMLMKLRIELSPGAQTITGLELSRDGSLVPREERGVAVPVDPGNYRVSATAPGRRAWSTEVIVREPGKVVTVSVPELAIEESGPRHETSPKRSVIPTIMLAGVAVAGVATGIGLTMAANSAADDAVAQRSALMARNAPFCNAYLPSDNQTAAECSALGEALSDKDFFTNAAGLAYVIGGLAVAGASVYAFWPASKPSKTVVVRPVPVVIGRETALWIIGSF
ncbi:MAG: tetratricopeptide repeat protein [Polyangiaceae bacterium]|nr:tetratricopeptide repeat protein [Polyangiaceae bacterium]